MVDLERAGRAGRVVLDLWRGREVVDSLGDDARPRSVREGYAAQAALAALAGEPVVGWKIAATAAAGQAHLAVDGPIAGRLLASRCHESGATVDVAGNRFLVAEAEFAFTLGADLPPRAAPYSREEVVDVVAELHPAIELPDSRFGDPTLVGEAQLAADNACADRFVLGPPAPGSWRGADLAAMPVSLLIDGETATTGHGSDVLGDPRDALAWLANAHALTGAGLERGQVVTTGVCGSPSPYRDGQRLVADFGPLGRVEALVAA